MANRFSVTPLSPAPVFNYWAAGYLRKQFSRRGLQPWEIISSVRDPVAMNISAFFQTIEHWIPDFMPRFNRGDIDVEELINVFIQKFPHDYALEWFDKEMRSVFNVDIYSYVFSKEKGYLIIEEAEIRLLLLRLEGLDDICSEAVSTFLKLPSFKLELHNSSGEKLYGKIYGYFVAQIRLPEGYMTRVYDSKLSRYFYSDIEIQDFKKKWSCGEVN